MYPVDRPSPQLNGAYPATGATTYHGYGGGRARPSAAPVAIRHGPSYEAQCVQKTFPTPAPVNIGGQSIVVTMDTHNRVRGNCGGVCDERGQPTESDPANPTNNVTIPLFLSEGAVRIV